MTASIGKAEAINETQTGVIVIFISTCSVLFAAYQYYIISLTPVEVYSMPDEGGMKSNLLVNDHSAEKDATKSDRAKQNELLNEIYEAVRTGAAAFLRAEYTICCMFCAVFAAIIAGLVSWGQSSTEGGLTALAFLFGAATSMVSGYIGMTVAVFSNARTCVNAQKPGFTHCFNTAFRAGSVMGFALNGLGLLILYILLLLYKQHYGEDDWDLLMECISGYGLGGSTVAMFGRVGGGIFTKAGTHLQLQF
jgi:Na+/H+-translocating membrane pyrophosphatase